MELAQRIEKYRVIEEYRGRPLIVYATSTRENVAAQMAADAVREFIDQIDSIEGSDKVDILIHSTGGDGLAAWKLMSIVRERFSEVTVLVPYMAFSAATIFALGADEIVMHPHASLGPIDPQLNVKLPSGDQKSFSYEDVGAFLRFLTDDAKITEQVHVGAIINRLFEIVDPVNIGLAKRASDLSTSMGERLLKTHMTGAEDRLQAKEIASELNKSFYSHGDAVSRSRALTLNLKIADRDETLENLMWDAFMGLEVYMALRKPFNPLHEFLSSTAAAASLQPPAPFILPPNTPQNLVEQSWQHVAQQALQRMLSTPGIEVDFELVNAVIESCRVASECTTKGKLSACRYLSGEVHLSHMVTESRWRSVQVP